MLSRSGSINGDLKIIKPKKTIPHKEESSSVEEKRPDPKRSGPSFCVFIRNKQHWLVVKRYLISLKVKSIPSRIPPGDIFLNYAGVKNGYFYTAKYPDQYQADLVPLIKYPIPQKGAKGKSFKAVDPTKYPNLAKFGFSQKQIITKFGYAPTTAVHQIKNKEQIFAAIEFFLVNKK
jgi:hypothetical protein